jgi:hypothetical protein
MNEAEVDGVEVVHFGRDFYRVFIREEAHEIKRQLAEMQVRFGSFTYCVKGLSGFSRDFGAQRV